MSLRLYTVDELIPAVPPPGGAPARQAPTTQVMVQVDGWPGNIFRLWLPEHVGQVWANWHANVAHQDFVRTQESALLWTFTSASGIRIEAEATPQGHLLTLTVRVTNGSDQELHHMAVANCIQFPLAPDFACGDLSRIFIRTSSQWQSLRALKPKSDYPHFFRRGLKPADGTVGWGGDLGHLFESTEADHALMVCVATDGRRCVGTASDDCEYLFHNRANQNLWCIHSTQAAVPVIKKEQTATFHQRVYFVDGGLTDCIKAFEGDGY